MKLSTIQINLVLRMTNPYSYPSFLKMCEEHSLPVLTMKDYLDEVNRLLPKKSSPTVLASSKPKVSCCGGGKLR